MFIRKNEVANYSQDGSYYPDFTDEYECDNCGGYIHESHPHVAVRGMHLCWNCGFINGELTEKVFLKHCPIHLNNLRAYVENGQIKYTTNKKYLQKEKTMIVIILNISTGGKQYSNVMITHVKDVTKQAVH